MGRCTADTADVAVGVVGIVIGSAGVDFLGQLILRIVGVAGTLICPGFPSNLRDVACLVILIAQVKLLKAGAAISLGIVNGGDLGGLITVIGAVGVKSSIKPVVLRIQPLQRIIEIGVSDHPIQVN